MECPHCGATLTLTAAEITRTSVLRCPNCGEPIEMAGEAGVAEGHEGVAGPGTEESAAECPNCGAELTFTVGQVGRRSVLRCPKCGEWIRLGPYMPGYRREARSTDEEPSSPEEERRRY